MEVTHAADAKRFVSLSSKSRINNNYNFNNNNIRPHSQPTYSFSQLTTTNLVIPPNMSSLTPGSRFLALPSELRLQVYDEYFSKCSHLDARQIYSHVLDSRHNSSATLSLLLVSKQVSNEVLDRLRKRQQHVYRITWHHAGFDDWAMACLRARKIKPDDYASIPHLRVDIYPPHPDRPSDMIIILKGVQDLWQQFFDVDRLRHVSVVFVESEVASWSTDGKLRMSIVRDVWRWDLYERDLYVVLYLLPSVNNMAKATIRLPDSVSDSDDLSVGEQSLHEFKASLEQSMMNISLLDEDFLDLACELLDDTLDINKLVWNCGE